MAVGLPILISAGAGALQGGFAGGVTGAMLGGALGAGVGALGLLNRPGKPRTGRGEEDVLDTQSLATLPVPIVFGRARLPGSVYIALGNFHGLPTEAEDDSARYQVMHAVLGLCEGPLPGANSAGNFHVDGKTIEDLLIDQPELRDVEIADQFDIHLIRGTNTESVPDFVLDVGATVTHGFTEVNAAGERVLVGSGEAPIPWRNTAKLTVKAGCGLAPRLVNVSADVVGPDYTRRRSGSTGASSAGAVAGSCIGYDAHKEAFWYTLASSSTDSTPFGLVRIGRSDTPARAHTQPPTAVVSNVTRGWYLSRHNVVVMQDPADSTLFWIGEWGIARGSERWEAFRPGGTVASGETYENAILGQHLDEQHGILHTLHNATTSVRYIMRWNLLTGRVEKLETDFPVPGAGYLAFAFTPDLDAYLLATQAGVLAMCDPQTGATFHSTTSVNLGSTVGLCSSGNRIGVVKADFFVYYDPQEETLEALGGNSTGLTEGALGGTVAAAQNTWTGHVTLAKASGGDVALINFIPSILEDIEDVSALGTKGEIEFQWAGEPWDTGIAYVVGNYVTYNAEPLVTDWDTDEIYDEGDLVDHGDRIWECKTAHFSTITNQPGAVESPTNPNFWDPWGGNPANPDTYKCTAAHTSAVANAPGSSGGTAFWELVEAAGPDPDSVTDWVRDWSYRTYNTYSLVSLEGNSSVAAAMWATLVEDTTLDTARWGAGFDESYFSLSSFESVHAYCVGGVQVANPKEDGAHAVTHRYAERYKCDLAIDSETSASEVVNTILASINGYRTLIGGKMHVAVLRRGALPVWHLTDHQLIDDETNVAFISRGDGYNRIRVQYTDVRSEYRQLPAEANDEFDQNARTVIADTVSMPSIGRHGHAEVLARTLLDNVTASRRRVSTKVHYLAYVFTPGDVLEFTHTATGLSRMRARLTELGEIEGSKLSLVALEQKVTFDALRDAGLPAPPLCVGDECDEEEDDDGPTEPGECEEQFGGTGSGVRWFNGGAAYAAGTYYVNYRGGAYMLTPDGGFAVEGYDLVTRDAAGEIIVLAAAPAVANPTGGYLTDESAEAANLGQTLTLTLGSDGPVGLRLRSGAAYTNTDDEGPVRYDLCINATAPCKGCPHDPCTGGCTETANCGNCWFSKDTSAPSVFRVKWAVQLNGNPACVPPIGDELATFADEVDGVLTWSATLPGGEKVYVRRRCATRHVQIIVSDADGDQIWVFGGIADECASGTFPLAADAIACGGDGNYTGDATLELVENPNPTDGDDCLTGKGCGSDDENPVEGDVCLNLADLPDQVKVTGSGFDSCGVFWNVEFTATWDRVTYPTTPRYAATIPATCPWPGVAEDGGFILHGSCVNDVGEWFVTSNVPENTTQYNGGTLSGEELVQPRPYGSYPVSHLVPDYSGTFLVEEV